jgi:hypothetical protein
LRNETQADVILMDLQYVPALLTPAKKDAAIESLDDESLVRARLAALNLEIAKANATVVEGPPTRLGTVDIDQIVVNWRQGRAANLQ